MNLPIGSWISAWNENSLEAWLRYFAVDTWNRIAFCHKNDRNRAFETTITQNMVYQLFQLQQLNAFPIQIEESTNERCNGNDLEIIIKTQDHYLLLPCQCKIISKDGRYITINHITNGRLQIDSLLDYARNIKGLPIYLFYNFNSNSNINEKISQACQIPIEAFGCSFTNASYLHSHYVKDNSWIVPTFDELHINNKSLPLELLTSFSDIHFTQKYLKHFSRYINFITELPVDLYHPTLSKLNWRSFIPSATIGRISPSSNDQVQYYEDVERSFAPAYRIIFDIDQLSNGK